MDHIKALVGFGADAAAAEGAGPVVSLQQAVLVDFADPSLWWALCVILFNPAMWNVVAQVQWRTGFLSRTLGPRGGCYLLAATIFAISLYRDVA